MTATPPPPDAAPKFDIRTAHSARRYNYWLGGKDNFQADRDSADAIEAIYRTFAPPQWKTAASCNAPCGG